MTGIVSAIFIASKTSHAKIQVVQGCNLCRNGKQCRIVIIALIARNIILFYSMDDEVGASKPSVKLFYHGQRDAGIAPEARKSSGYRGANSARKRNTQAAINKAWLH